MIHFINLDFYSALLLIGSMLLSVQMVPQIYHIYTLKSARDISYGTIFIVLFGVTTIVIYGLHYDAFELWFPPLIQIICMTTVLLMKIYYGRNEERQPVMTESYIERPDNVMSSHVVIGIRHNDTLNDGMDN